MRFQGDLVLLQILKVEGAQDAEELPGLPGLEGDLTRTPVHRHQALPEAPGKTPQIRLAFKGDAVIPGLAVARRVQAGDIHDPAVLDHRHLIADLFNLLKAVAGHEDRPPLPLLLPDEPDEAVTHQRVEARRQLVQNQVPLDFPTAKCYID